METNLEIWRTHKARLSNILSYNVMYVTVGKWASIWLEFPTLYSNRYKYVVCNRNCVKVLLEFKSAFFFTNQQNTTPFISLMLFLFIVLQICKYTCNVRS